MSHYRTTPAQSTRMPGGIPYIIGNELAERFSFYGMKGILVIFMTKYLLDASGALATFSDEKAKTVYHMFTAAAYFFPIIGAIIADVFLGKYRTILFLSLMYCVGHGCLAVMDLGPVLGFNMAPWMYAGLLFIAMGAGAIKPCVSAHVGDQFGDGNKHLIPKIFSWFYFSINVGAATSTLLTPFFLENVGPWLAFGTPGVLMAIATFMFWLGRNKFIHVPPSGPAKFMEETFSPDGRRALMNLAPLFLIFIPMFWALFDQTGSSWVLQATKMDREFAGINWLPSQIQAANPIFILILIPVFTYVLYPALNKIVKMTPLRRMAMGLFVTIIAFSCIAMIEENIEGGEVSGYTSMSSAKGWQKQGILDGDPDGYGWSSGKNPDKTQEVIIRLRERRTWLINSIELNPYTITGEPEKSDKKARDAWKKLSKEQKIEADQQPDMENWVRTVTVFVRDDDDAVQGDTWAEVGTIELAQENAFQLLSFDAVKASHVKMRMDNNWGGTRMKLGRARVLAAGTYPAVSGSDQPAPPPDIWPNVSGLGHKPNIIWQLLAYIIITAAEVMVSITSLEFAYTQAPKRMKSFIMGVYFLGVSLGNLFTAAVNFFIQEEGGGTKLEGASYFWFFTVLMAVTAVLFMFFSAVYKGQTFIQGDDHDSAHAEAQAVAPDSR